MTGTTNVAIGKYEDTALGPANPSLNKYWIPNNASAIKLACTNAQMSMRLFINTS